MNSNVGLMIEGGGMRCAYSIGVLDLFLEKELEFKSVATASAGAVIAGSFISKQKKRNYDMLSHLSDNGKAISIFRFFKEKELFNMNYIFDEIPKSLFPLDFNNIKNSETELIIGTTEINTGEPVYYNEFNSLDDLNMVTRASCSLPVLASSVKYDGRELMDGGVSNPLLIEPLLERGLTKNVIILTRNFGYKKQATQLNWLYKRLFKDKHALRKLLKYRHRAYNSTMEMINELQKRGELFVIQPELPLLASRVEQDKFKLQELYMLGYRDAKKKYEDLKAFISGIPVDQFESRGAVDFRAETTN